MDYGVDFYAIGALAFALLGFSKVGFAGGMGGLAVPLLAIVVPVPQAAAITLPALLITDIVAVWTYRRHADWANLRILLPALLVGLGLGYVTFLYANDDMFRVALGGISFWIVLQAWVTTRMRGDKPHRPAGRSWIAGSFWSAVAGLTSFIAHAGGPPIQVYLMPQRLNKSVLVGTNAIYFAIANYLKIVPFWFLGQWSFDNLAVSLWLTPAAAMGAALGIWLHNKVDDARFYFLSYAMLVVAGAKLLWDGAVGLLSG